MPQTYSFVYNPDNDRIVGDQRAVLHLMRRVAFDWDFPELCPHTAYLIPPDTQFSELGKRLDHFSIHFVLPDDAVFTRKGLYEVTRSDELRTAVQSLADRVLFDADDRCAIAAAGLVLSSLPRLHAAAFHRARGTSPAAFRRISDQPIARPAVL